jgi:hypothetical protein
MILSIQHSGTYFLIDYLGWDGVAQHFLPNKEKIVQVQTDFGMNNVLVPAIDLDQQLHVPLRHPLLVAVSWQKRNMLGQAGFGFGDAWKQMSRLLKDRDYVFFEPGADVGDTNVIFYDVAKLGTPPQNYPEQASLEAARQYLAPGMRKFIDERLHRQCPIAKYFY